MILIDKNGTFHAEPDYDRAELKALLDRATADLTRWADNPHACVTRDAMIHAAKQKVRRLENAMEREDG